MRAFARHLLAIATLAVPAAALAGGSSAPFGYTPDPTLRTAPATDLQERIRRACASTQARLQGATPAQMGRPCGCYAASVMRTLTPAEVEAYRGTGVFNEGARAKAFAALDGCKLRRPG